MREINQIIQMTKLDIYKEQYERYLGKPVSVSTWYRIREVCSFNELDFFNLEHLKLIADLKNEYGDNKTPFELIVKNYLESLDKYKHSCYTGESLYNTLKEIAGASCKKTTIIRWFSVVDRDAEGKKFSKKRIYTFNEVFTIFLKAYSYARKYNKASKYYQSF